MQRQIRNSKSEIRNKPDAVIEETFSVSRAGSAPGLGRRRVRRLTPPGSPKPFGFRISCFGFHTGYTLVEMLIVTVIIGILATVAVPAMYSAQASGLKAAGRVFASDLRLASDLAIQYGTEYTVDFDVKRNLYEIRHTGSGNPPPLQNPQAPPGTPAGTYVVEFGPFGGNGTNPNGVRLLGAELKTSDLAVTNISFGPQGGTGPTRTDDTQIWLRRGTGGQTEYLRLTVSAVTGQVWLDQPKTYPAN